MINVRVTKTKGIPINGLQNNQANPTTSKDNNVDINKANKITIAFPNVANPGKIYKT